MRPSLVKPGREPNETLVDALQTLLKAAQAGELQGLAYVCELKTGKVSEGWNLTGENGYRILGSLHVLGFRLARLIAPPEGQ